MIEFLRRKVVPRRERLRIVVRLRRAVKPHPAAFGRRIALTLRTAFGITLGTVYLEDIRFPAESLGAADEARRREFQ
jgi:hypothetical protein